MKVAVINTYDSKDINVWAGIPYHLSMMFDRIFCNDITYLQINPKRNLLSYIRGFYFNRILKKKYLNWADEKLYKWNRKIILRQIKEDYDLIITYQFFLVPILKTKKNKIIWWSDATFNNLLNFYPYVTNVSDYCVRSGHHIQKQALDVCEKFILSSDWAIQSALKNYGADKNKAAQIPFAPNLNHQLSCDDIDVVLDNKQKDIIKLLFIGINWERKGGDEAVKLVNALNSKGYVTQLYVVGTEIPKIYSNNNALIEVGFLDKNVFDDCDKLNKLLKESTYLVLASLSDCTPIVFSEANGNALPVITTNVGGISSVVKDGINGYVYIPQSFVQQAAETIIENKQNINVYRELCYSSFNYYKDNFTWEKVEYKFRDVLKKIIDNPC